MKPSIHAVFRASFNGTYLWAFWFGASGKNVHRLPQVVPGHLGALGTCTAGFAGFGALACRQSAALTRHSPRSHAFFHTVDGLDRGAHGAQGLADGDGGDSHGSLLGCLMETSALGAESEAAKRKRQEFAADEWP